MSAQGLMSKNNQAKEKASKASKATPVVQSQESEKAVVDISLLQLALGNVKEAGATHILALQRQAGNQATNSVIQAKLYVGPAGDHYEKEADRVADQVMRMPAASEHSPKPVVQRQATDEAEGEGEAVQAKPLASAITPLVQRQADEEDEDIQAKPLGAQITPLVQRQVGEEEETIQRQADEEEENIQSKPTVGRRGDGFLMAEDTEHHLTSQRGHGIPLPSRLRSDMEARFGADFGQVRIHHGGDSSRLNKSIRAQAFTHGRDIYLGEGKDDIQSSHGRRLLAHELTHVIQQGAAGLRTRRTGAAQPSLKSQKASRAIVQRVTLADIWDTTELKQRHAKDKAYYAKEGGLGSLISPTAEGMKRGLFKRSIAEGGRFTKNVAQSLGHITGKSTAGLTKKVHGWAQSIHNPLSGARTVHARRFGTVLKRIGQAGAWALGGTAIGLTAAGTGALTGIGTALSAAAPVAAGIGGGLATIGSGAVMGTAQGAVQGFGNMIKGVKGTAKATGAAFKRGWGDSSQGWRALTGGGTNRAKRYFSNVMHGLRAFGAAAAHAPLVPIAGALGAIGMVGKTAMGTVTGALSGTGGKDVKKAAKGVKELFTGPSAPSGPPSTTQPEPEETNQLSEQGGTALTDPASTGIGLADLGMDKSNWQPGLHTRNYTTYAAETPTALTGYGGSSVGLMGSSTGASESASGMGEAGEEITSALKPGSKIDKSRLAGGYASMGSNLLSGTSSLANIGSGLLGIAQTAGVTTSAATSAASTFAPMLPGLGLATSAIGGAKDVFQLSKAGYRAKKLSNLHNANQGDAEMKKSIEFAQKTNKKRAERSGVNLTSNVLGVTGNALMLSGVAAGAGAAVAAGGTAIKLGAWGLRKGKQALRNWIGARHESPNSKAQFRTYADWKKDLYTDKSGQEKKGAARFMPWLVSKMAVNWDKTTANKEKQYSEQADRLINHLKDPAKHDTAQQILEHLGANREDIANAQITGGNALTNAADLKESIIKMYKKRD